MKDTHPAVDQVNHRTCSEINLADSANDTSAPNGIYRGLVLKNQAFRW